MVDYDKNSCMQTEVVRSKEGVLRNLVERIGPLPRTFVVADYGCGPGHSAVATVRPAIEAYRALSAGPVVVRHADQPGNDWNGLLAIVFGPDGYHHLPAVRTETAVGSFYDELALPASVALATSFAACHWLSRPIALNAPGTVFFADLEGEARTEMASLARTDWTRFLRARARELMPGGYGFFATLGSEPAPNEPGGIRASAHALYRAIHDVALAMAEDGRVDAAALERFVFPLWFRTSEELIQPIAEEGDLNDAFEIVEAGVQPLPSHPDDVFADFVGNPVEYGRRYAGYVRGFGESSLRLHLFGPSAADKEEEDALLADFFSRLADHYAAAPGRQGSRSLIASLIVRRR